MTSEPFATAAPATVTYAAASTEAPRSAVSWSAILAGAVVAGASSLMMLALGTGFGFAAGKPWPGHHPSAADFTVASAVWLVLTQWFASGLGGYTAGRLRTRWTGVHTHEVFFRDTAHGFITWATATVMVAALAVGAAGLGGAVLGARAADGDAAAEGPYAAQVDAMFRSARPDESPSAAAVRAEAGRILARNATGGPKNLDDRPYLASLVAVHTGLLPDVAQVRADVGLTDARLAAEKARKAAAASAIFTGLAMLIGAFIACVAAALGGRLRDEHP